MCPHTCNNYRSSFGLYIVHSSNDSFLDSNILSVIPDIELRYNISCIAFQSSSDTKTAFSLYQHYNVRFNVRKYPKAPKSPYVIPQEAYLQELF